MVQVSEAWFYLTVHIPWLKKYSLGMSRKPLDGILASFLIGQRILETDVAAFLCHHQSELLLHCIETHFV
jgi:hypothetical protein